MNMQTAKTYSYRGRLDIDVYINFMGIYAKLDV